MELLISDLMSPSHKITKEEKNRLKLLKEEYPWSADIRIAYLKGLKETSDLSFSDELKRVALVTNDRARLYKILYAAALEKTILKVEQEMEALPEVEGLIPADWEKVYSTDTEPEAEVSVDITPIKISPLEELESSPVESKDELPKERKEDSEEIEKITELKPISESENQTESAEEALETKLSAEINEEIEELNHLIISEAVDTSITMDVMEDIQAKKEHLKDSIPQGNSADLTKKPVSSDDFINWLIASAQSVNYPSFSDKGAVKPTDYADSIIDNFIQKEPQISRGKSKEYSLENLAAESLVDNEEFVTETLAEIYADQGNNSKAKRAFQLLSLKYPEKSIYFAARIKRLGRKK
jgi:hypothetical protein|tara:strand:- start:379 stop:1446 length:1068 start_codon:yes stop_codon:yes gene_type:complete